MSRELHIITERPKTERIPSVLKIGQTEVRFSSGVGFGLGFLSPMIGERDGAREGGTEGERGRDTQRQREGGREILTAEEKNFFFCPARVRGWQNGGREGEREMDEGTRGGGGERESEGEGGREILTAEEKKNSSSAPREIEGGGREGGRGRETKTEREGGGREGGKGERGMKGPGGERQRQRER